MHIAIDAHMVGERETGNETYTLNLARALLELTGRDPKGFSWDAAGPPNATQALSSTKRDQQRRFGASPRLSLLTPHPDRLQAALPELKDCLHAQILPIRPANALLRIPFTMPLAALRGSFDLLHVTYNAPPLCPCPTVVTIHDISFERYPQFFSPRDRLILKTLVPWSARRAARVITGSQHTKAEIIARYGLSPEKVVVTYHAAGPQFQPVTDQAQLQAVRRKYGIGEGPYVLALGNLQPRKNIARLVEAVAAASRHDISRRKVMSSLVIAGKAQWRESEIYRAVAAASLQERIAFPGYIDDADLPALYSAATAFVYPSLYEGFGLPPLEAMACGTPVICSNAASLPEVVGDAALSFDPADSQALAQALVDVLDSPGLQADLRARGLQRAAQFSWQRCAAETLAVYVETLARPTTA